MGIINAETTTEDETWRRDRMSSPSYCPGTPTKEATDIRDCSQLFTSDGTLWAGLKEWTVLGIQWTSNELSIYGMYIRDAIK